MSGDSTSEKVGKVFGVLLAGLFLRACFSCAGDIDSSSANYHVEQANNRQAVAYSHKVQSEAFDSELKKCTAEANRVRGRKARSNAHFDCLHHAMDKGQAVGDRAWKDTKRCIAEKGAANCPRSF